MDDGGSPSSDRDDTKRKTRNLSEKKRRDQFNMLVHELSTMVSTNSRKMDKSTVLKSTISFLKNHKEVTVQSRAHDVQEDWKPAFLSNEEFTYLVLEALEGFVMMFSPSGRIYYVSESISLLLGHNPADLVNTSVFDITYEKDRPNLYNLLQTHTNMEQMQTSAGTDSYVQFQMHMRRGSVDFGTETYDLVQFNGHFRGNVEPSDGDPDVGYKQECKSRMFLCTGRLKTPQLIRDSSLVDPTRNEFTSRHSLEWKFLFLDHRAPPIIGYLPFEVLGTSGYDYYHFDDLEKVVTCHEALMQKGELTSCFYRFLTKGQQWIWLQTRYCITYHQWNSKPEFVVCTHRVLSYIEVQNGSKEDMEPNSGNDVDFSEMTEGPTEDAMAPLSPSYRSDNSDTFAAPYQPNSQSTSVKSGMSGDRTSGTASSSWQRASAPFHPDSDKGSVSGESRASTTNSMRETKNRQEMTGYEESTTGYQQGHESLKTLAPQYEIGARYLDPVPYVGPVPVRAVLPLVPTLPVLVSPAQNQIQWPWQDQLQRRHEKLQELIARQQEELRRVKEQLLLARLGILQPLINVQHYPVDEEMGQQPPAPGPGHPHMQPPRSQPPAGYDEQRVLYAPPRPPHPPHPPHPPGPHHMPH